MVRLNSFIPKENYGYAFACWSCPQNLSSFLDIFTKVSRTSCCFRFRSSAILPVMLGFVVSHNVLFSPFSVCQSCSAVSPLQSDSTCVRFTLPECECHRFRFHPGGVPREQPERLPLHAVRARRLVWAANPSGTGTGSRPRRPASQHGGLCRICCFLLAVSGCV